MIRKTSKESLERDLENLRTLSQQTPTLSLQDVIRTLEGKGSFCLALFLALPFCQPLQIPGFSTPFGCAIAFLGGRIALGKDLWLPKRLLDHTISSASIQKIAQTSLDILKKIHPLLHPRFYDFFSSAFLESFHGILILILGLLLALPLPIPLSNLMAGWSILLLTLGTLECDGVFIILSYLATGLSFLFFGLTLFVFEKLFF